MPDQCAIVCILDNGVIWCLHLDNVADMMCGGTRRGDKMPLGSVERPCKKEEMTVA